VSQQHSGQADSGIGEGVLRVCSAASWQWSPLPGAFALAELFAAITVL
jgi:hypothetical protein